MFKCTYNLLHVCKWIDQKFDVEWKYVLCFIFAHTAFLLQKCWAEETHCSLGSQSTQLFRLRLDPMYMYVTCMYDKGEPDSSFYS